jgi:hypothetical protein
MARAVPYIAFVSIERKRSGWPNDRGITVFFALRGRCDRKITFCEFLRSFSRESFLAFDATKGVERTNDFSTQK